MSIFSVFRAVFRLYRRGGVLLAVWLCCGTVGVHAQFFSRDSLLRELSTQRQRSAVRDSNYVRLLFLVARSYRPNTTQMRPFVEEARLLVPLLRSTRMKALFYLNVGNILRLERNFTEARDTLQYALDLFREVRDSSNISSTVGLMAVMYQQRDMYSMALQYYMQELEIASKCGDIKNDFLARVNLSEISAAMQQPQKALTFVREAEPVMRRNANTAFFTEWCKSMATAHRLLGNGDSAVYYAQKGVKSAWKLHDTLLVIHLIAQEIRGLSLLHRHQEAEKRLDSLLALEKQSMQGGTIRPSGYLLAAETLLASAHSLPLHPTPTHLATASPIKQSQSLLVAALNYAQAGLAHKAVSKKEQADLYAVLSEIYGDLGKTDAAFQAQRKLIALRDSLFTTTLQASITDMQERYALLQKVAEMKVVEERERRSLLLNGLLTALAFCGLFVAGLSYHRYRMQQRSEIALHEANTRLKQLYDETVSYKNRIEEQNTSLLQQEQILRNSLQDKQFLAIVARHATQIVIITDGEGKAQFVNDEFEKTSGYAPFEILGKKPGSLLQGAETDPATVQEIRTCIRERKPFNGDILNYTKSGRPYWVHLSLSPVFNEQGDCEYFIGIQYDITEERHRQAKERLQAELTMQSMIDSAREITMLVGADFRMIQFNKAAERAMRGMIPNAEPRVGMDMRVYSPIPLHEVERDFAEVMQGKTVSFDLDMINPSNSAETLTFEVSYAPVRNPEGIIIAVSFVARNITHRKQIQTQIEQMNEWLEQRVHERTKELERRALELSTTNNKLAAAYSDLEMAQLELWSKNRELASVNRLLDETSREKSEILGIVAHDLKSPLSGIQGLADILRTGMNQEQTQQAANEIYKASERMFALITNLLSVNAIESGNLALDLIPIDAGFVVEMVMEQYSFIAVAKEIQFIAELPLKTCLAMADESALPQIVENLVSNAVKYSPHRTTVRLRVFERLETPEFPEKASSLTDMSARLKTALPLRSAVRIEVQDEGPGISEDDMRKLFSKFARLSAQPTGGEHSTGLGLSIVKKLIEAMQGNVWCESELGKGATFIVELPRAEETAYLP